MYERGYHKHSLMEKMILDLWSKGLMVNGRHSW